MRTVTLFKIFCNLKEKETNIKRKELILSLQLVHDKNVKSNIELDMD